MWKILSSIETILGLIGSIVSFLTFLLALRVKRTVDETLDRIEFREEYQELSGVALGFLDILELEKDIINTDNFKRQVSDYLSKLSSKYSFFPRKIKSVIKKIDKIVLSDNQHKFNKELELRKLFVQLSSYLEKEAKQ